MRRVHIRTLRHTDREVVTTIFAGLSPASRHRRFHTPVRELTPAMIDALVDVDGHRHVGFVAELRRGRHREPVGIARYVREADGTAEIAVAVIDRCQGQGVGTRLIRRLVKEAYRQGVRQLVGDLLADNEPAHALLAATLPTARYTRHGATTRVVAVLDPGPLTMHEVLAELGSGRGTPTDSVLVAS